MKKIILTFTILLLFSNHIFSQSNNTITAETIVNNSIQAIGGAKYLKSIKTLYTDLKTEMEGREVNWITKEMLSNKGAFQIIYKDRVVYQNWYDGIKGYEIVNGEKKEAKIVSLLINEIISESDFNK